MYNTNKIISDILNKNKTPNVPPKLLEILKVKSKSPMWSGDITINNKKITNKVPLNELSKVKSKVILLQAGTGSGKSLSIAPYLMQNQKNEKKIILTQPRVLTTKSIASRMSEELCEDIGDRVGYITGSGKIINNKNGKIEIITEGILLKQLFSNSFKISNYSYILIDEVHERNPETDLVIYKLKQLIESGRFKGQLIIMSATLDINSFKTYFGKNYSIVKISGIQPEINLNFLNNIISNYQSEIVNTINRINNDIDDDILVFLPTKLALNEVKSSLNFTDSLVILLYSGVSPQEEALISNELVNYRNRIILATDVAETGITFPNLKYVIDSGWKNKPYYDPYIDAKMLIMDTISKGQALQRWGRVGRRFPGIVYCIYTKEHFINMDSRGVSLEKIKTIIPDYTETIEVKNPSGEPSIVSSNIDSLILMLFNEEKDISTIKLIDNPTFETTLRSTDKLLKLGAIDTFGKITIIGKLMNNFKYPLIDAKLLCIGSTHRCIEEIIIIIAMKFVGLNKLINVRKQRTLLINEYYSDHINLLLVYKKYSIEKYNHIWLSENNINIEAFDMVEAEINTIKQKLNNLRIPYFPKKFHKLDEMVHRIKTCLYRNLFYNLAVKTQKNGSTYYQIVDRPEILVNVSNSIAFTTDFSSANELFPKYIVFEELMFISGKYSITNATSIPKEIINFSIRII